MKKYINKLLFLVLILSATSCSEDYLSEEPTNAYTPASALSTPENMVLAINGIHREMYAQSPLDDYTPGYAGEQYIMAMLEFGAGDYIRPIPGVGWHAGASKWTSHTNPSSNNVSWTWFQYYHIIGSVNNIINAAEGMADNLDNNDLKVLNNVLGQAYAYRAWAHHRLVCLYAKNPQYTDANSELGVPIMLKTASPFVGQARESVAAVYAQCETDIKAAIAYLSDVKSSGNSHINVKVANGIAARIALTKGDFSTAATYANAARQGYSLMGETDYKSGFNSALNKEWMWAGTVLADQTTYYRSWFYYVAMNFNGSFDRGTPRLINKTLFNQISTTDYRRDLFLDKMPNTTVKWTGNTIDPNYDPNYPTKGAYDAAIVAYNDEYFNSKKSFKKHPYQAAKFLQENAATIEPEDILYMRVSEMYLIEAEALAKSDDDDGAATVLFDLVSTRDAAYTKSTKTGAALIAEILLQRRIEMFGEGHRWLDMLRNDEALDLTGSDAQKSYYLAGYKQDKPSVNKNWLFQIPQAEMDANKLMVQNPTADL